MHSWSHPKIPAFSLLLLMFTAVARGQFPVVRFEHISRAQGLPSAEIFSMLMDRQGFLWFGAAGGLARYDGIRFTTVQPPMDPSLGATQNVIYEFIESRDGILWCATQAGGILRFDPVIDTITRFTAASHGLSSNEAYAVCEDVQGTLWVGTSGGLDTLDILSGRFRHIARPSRDGPLFVNAGISSIREFPRGSGVIWIGTYGEGVLRYDRRQEVWTLWQGRSFDPHGPHDGNIQQLFMSEKTPGVLWVGTPEGGLYHLHVATGTWDRVPLSPGRERISSPGRVRWISESPEGMLLVATTGTGLYFVDPLTGRTKNISSDPQDPGSLSHNEVTCTLVDSSGILWVGTYHGIYKANPLRSLFTSYHYSSGRRNGLTHNAVTAICEDGNGALWVGTRGGGLDRFNRRTGIWSAWTRNARNVLSLATNELCSLFEDRSGKLWVGGAGGWLHRFRLSAGTFDRRQIIRKPSDPDGTRVLCIHLDRRKVLWLGTGYGLMRFDPETGTARPVPEDDPDSGGGRSGAVRAILEDRDGDLWIGTTLGGLRRMHRQTGRVETFAHVEGDSGSLSALGVRALLEDRNGRIWVGTGGGGLDRFNGETNRFDVFTQRDGLSGNYVNGLLEDRGGRIWAATNRGISAFEPLTGQWSQFDESDGLQGDVFIIGASCRCADGTLCFGGINGLTLFRPDTLFPNTHAPPIVLTGVELGGRRLMAGRGTSYVTDVSYASSDKVLSFEFAVLDYRRPDRNTYVYHMDGLDKGWVQPFDRQNAVYFHLVPGRYVLRVKGTNNAGISTRNILEIPVVVEPQYWETLWFRLMLWGALGVALAGAYVLSQRRRLLRYSNEKLLQDQFMRQQIESQEFERKRLAAELHDGLGQDLLVASNELQQFLHNGDGSSEEVERAAALVHESIQTVREIASNLHPHHLDRLGFCAAVETMSEAISHSTGLTIECTCDSVDRLLKKETEIHAYRITQEALSNVVSHALATKVIVRVKEKPGAVEITVSDNGQGFTVPVGPTLQSSRHPGETTRGFGFLSMSERARIIGGTLTITSSPGSGCTINLTLPKS